VRTETRIRELRKSSVVQTSAAIRFFGHINGKNCRGKKKTKKWAGLAAEDFTSQHFDPASNFEHFTGKKEKEKKSVLITNLSVCVDFPFASARESNETHMKSTGNLSTPPDIYEQLLKCQKPSLLFPPQFFVVVRFHPTNQLHPSV